MTLCINSDVNNKQSIWSKNKIISDKHIPQREALEALERSFLLSWGL